MAMIRFCLIDYDEITHPVSKMKELGYKILDAIPQTVGDQWWFEVEEVIYPLPKYLTVMKEE